MSPAELATIYAYTALGVGIILAAAGLGSALGWGLICSKFMEGIARQPEMRPQPVRRCSQGGHWRLIRPRSPSS